MNIIFLILLIVAGLLAVLDLVLANAAAGRKYWLLPVSMILVVLALILNSAGAL